MQLFLWYGSHNKHTLSAIHLKWLNKSLAKIIKKKSKNTYTLAQTTLKNAWITDWYQIDALKRTIDNRTMNMRQQRGATSKNKSHQHKWRQKNSEVFERIVSIVIWWIIIDVGIAHCASDTKPTASLANGATSYMHLWQFKSINIRDICDPNDARWSLFVSANSTRGRNVAIFQSRDRQRHVILPISCSAFRFFIMIICWCILRYFVTARASISMILIMEWRRISGP